jgi:hypothetical protein
MFMASKKLTIDQAAKNATKLLIEHMETLSPDQAAAVRANLRALALKGRVSNRGKASRVRKNEDSHPSRRTSAKTA